MDVRTPPYRPYAETKPPFRWRLGLRPLDLADWIEIDERYAIEIAEKERVMGAHPDTAFAVLDDERVTAASAEVLELVSVHLRSVPVPEPRPRPDLHPLDAAGRLVQEDLVLLVEIDGQLICGGGSVCFPNRWDLRSKIGLPLTAIHAPVPRLNEQLGEATDRFLERLTPERPMWRLGWGVLDTDELYQAVDGTATRPAAGVPPSDHHLRVERETLRRLPATGAVLFTIRTHVTPLSGISRGVEASTLADAIDDLPHDVAVYKELHAVGSSIADWLRR